MNILQAATIDPTQIRRCPMCQGRGFDDTMQNQAGGTYTLRGKRPMVPVCTLCRGGRVVYMDKICTCGSAAVLYNPQDKFWWCGRDVCNGVLKAMSLRQANYARANNKISGCLP